LVNGYQYRLALLGAEDIQTDSPALVNNQVIDKNLVEWFSTIALNLIQGSQVQTIVSSKDVVAVQIKGDELCLFVALSQVENGTTVNSRINTNDIDSSWLDMLLAKKVLTRADVRHLLRNQADDEFTQGKQVCSCFSVRENTIKNAIETGFNSVALLGEKLQCGTNCGSCKPELSTLIAQNNKSSQKNKSNRSMGSNTKDQRMDALSLSKKHIDVIQIEVSK
jgi:assimilatory nitrate reductase catalytic subunit